MSFELIAEAQGKLTLKRAGVADESDVRIRRAFPWSKPEQWISVRSGEGKELILVEDLAGLDPATRQIISDYLAQTVLIPKIERIESIDVRFGYQQWSVQTDRGQAGFRVQEREDIRFLPDGRYSIRDADGNVYELRRLTELDEHSRTQLGPLI
jgi:hypothetical protein